MPSHPVNGTSPGIAAAPAPVLGAAPTAGAPASPGLSEAGNDDLTTLGRKSPATAAGPDNMTGKAPSVSAAATYIYGYDAGGNPTLTDAGHGGTPGRDPRTPRQ